jgi:SseB protein N-terminal domain/SseB protein C-terminal domain
LKFFDRVLGRKNANPLEDGNQLLLQAMQKVATNDNPENRKELYEAFLASMLLLPVPEPPAELSPGMHTLQSGVQLQFVRLMDARQTPVSVAFTDAEALRNWDPNTPYLGLKAVDIFRALITTDIHELVLNPFDPIRKMIRPGGRVKRAEFEVLANGQIPSDLGHQQIRINAEEKVLVGLPANPPSAAIQELLRGRAMDISAVSELYFFQMARGQSSNTVIGIGLAHEVDDKAKQEIAQALGTAIQHHIEPGKPLDLMFLNGPFGEHIRKIGGVIFRRL